MLTTRRHHLSTSRRPVDVTTGQVVVRVSTPLDDAAAAHLAGCLRRRVRRGEVVLARLEGCDFVNARGFRALVRLQGEVEDAGGRLLVLDPPRSLRLVCRSFPGRLELVPATSPGAAA
ncbi:STAS domain-containing protein [Klenkia brasiliensis]|uniref:STAS domain-containing protein n=1 Tax=Klenkia brasiliensis TaxID=333142 RepID=A0A1G7QJ37_9ACTN|nr:STAS domain-containing protein [Klenkia brasiliensis]SDF98534.1 hypothetical protein SAMN05660324_1503 [Klenkia brasiliensis]